MSESLQTMVAKAEDEIIALAAQLHSYMTFCAKEDGFSYEFDADWFEVRLNAGVFSFFGIETDGKRILRDVQQPKLLAQWRKALSTKCKCPICHKKKKTSEPLHTSDVIRALGVELEWDNLAICGDCFVVIDLTFQIAAKHLNVTLPRDH
jgi:hypothetical protein